MGSMRSDAAGTPGQNGGYPGGKRGSPFQAGPFAERPFTEEGDVDSTPQWGRCCCSLFLGFGCVILRRRSYPASVGQVLLLSDLLGFVCASSDEEE